MTTQNAKKKISIRLFGVLSMIDDNGREIVPPGKRAKALVAMLILSTNGVRHRKWLQETLWSTRSEEQRAASLRQELSSLRRHFKKFDVNLIETDRETIRLSLKYYEIRTDVAVNHSSNLQILEGLDIRDTAFRNWLKNTRRNLEHQLGVDEKKVPLSDIAGYQIKSHVAINDSPIIHITPFKSIGDSKKLEIFAQGLTEELLTIFGRLVGYFNLVTDLSHIGSEPHLILEGAVRQGKTTRVTTRLVSAPDATCVWSERYSLDSTDKFSVQEQIARTLVEQTQQSLTEGDWASIWTGRSTSTATWESFQLGRYCENQFHPAKHEEAIAHYQAATETDPAYTPAKVAIGFCLVDMVRLGWVENPEETIHKANKIVQTVHQGEKNDGYVVALSAFIEVASGNHTRARDLMDLSMEQFNNKSPELLGYYGAILGYDGDLEGEYDKYTEALNLTNYPPLWIRTNLALVCLLLGRDEAKKVANYVLTIDENNIRAHIVLAANYARQGDLDKASQCAKRILKIQPDFSANTWSNPDCFRNAESHTKVIKYLNLAGLQ